MFSRMTPVTSSTCFCTSATEVLLSHKQQMRYIQKPESLRACAQVVHLHKHVCCVAVSSATKERKGGSFAQKNDKTKKKKQPSLAFYG